MKKPDLNRMILENTVSRALADMEKDSHRTARKLVDMGLFFSRGPFERYFFTLCANLLEEEDSLYYDAINRALRDFDRKSLITFGINVGLEGCSRGARLIRETEEAEGFQVPWALELYAGEEALDFPTTQRVINEAIGLGVHVFYLHDQAIQQEPLETLLQEHPTCAFALFTRPSRTPDWNLDSLSSHENLLVCVHGEEPESEALCSALKERKMLFGVYLPYQDTQNLSQRIEKAGDLGGLLVLLCDQHSSEENRQAVHRLVLDARQGHQYPFGVIDLPEDLLAIDRVISHDHCSVCLLPDGRVVTPNGITPSNIKTASLSEILKKELPR